MSAPSAVDGSDLAQTKAAAKICVPSSIEAGDFEDDALETSSADFVKQPAVLSLDPPRAIDEQPHDIALAWTPAVLDHHSEGERSWAVQYLLQYTPFTSPDQSVADLAWQTYYQGPELQCKVGHLRAGRLHAFRVGACVKQTNNDSGEGPVIFASHVLAATLPTKPVGMRVPMLTSRARNNLKLKWRQPDEDGGLPLQYALYLQPPPLECTARTDSQGFAEVYRGPDITFKVVRLRPGTNYQAVVQAFNSLGASERSPPLQATTQSSVPSVPDPPQVLQASDSSVTLRWQAPEGNGEPVSRFVLEADNGDGGAFELVYNGPLTECCVTCLLAGQTYRFRVAAWNGIGVSQWSPICSAKTGFGRPDAPGPPKVIGSNRTLVTLKWEAPEETGGADVVSYEAQVHPKSRAAVLNGLPEEWVLVYQGASAACTIGSLKAGCTYRVRVRARSVAGYGDYSAPVDVTTSPDTPDPPRPPTASDVGQTSLTLHWAPPQHDGGSAVTGYNVQLWRGEAGDRVGSSASLGSDEGMGGGRRGAPQPPGAAMVYSGPETACLVQGLLPGMHYCARVQAINGQGGGHWSAAAGLRTRVAAPLAPMFAPCAAAASAASLTVAWQEAEGRGAPVTSYTLQLAEAPRGEQGEAAGEEGTGACGGSSDTTSDGTAASNTTDAHLQPHTPPNGCEEGGSGGGGAPSAAKAVPLRFRTVYEGAATACEVTGLQPFTEHLLRVKACNAAGSSDWSELLPLRTGPGPPSEPLALLAQGTSSSSVALRWQEPRLNNGAPVTSYSVEHAQAPSRAKAALLWARTTVKPVCSCVVAGLSPGRSYLFRVRANNSSGVGPWSQAVGAETLAAPPGPPGTPTFSGRTWSSVRVKWAPPDDEGGSSVTEYSLEMSAAGLPGFLVVYRGKDASSKVTGLAADEQYVFRVQARNGAGAGQHSMAGTVVTAKQPPKPPTHVEVQVVGPGVEHSPWLEVRWQPPIPDTLCAECAGYEVEVAVAGGGGKPTIVPLSSKLTSHRVAAAAGAAYNVRVRCIGAEGAGHGCWSATVPAAALELPAPAPAGPPASVAATGGGASRRRGGKNSSANGDAMDTDVAAARSGKKSGALRTEIAGTKAVVAKGPPRKTTLLGLPRKKTLGTIKKWVLAVLLTAIFIAFIGLVIAVESQKYPRMA